MHNEAEIRRILPIAKKHGVPITFRAAGTSLSGQAITDSVLLKLSHTGKNFRNYTIHVSAGMCARVWWWALGRRRGGGWLAPGCVRCGVGLCLEPPDSTMPGERRGPTPAPPHTPRACIAQPQGDGSSITVEPGLILGEVNKLLAAHAKRGGHPIQYKMGPDPSSIDSCMIGARPRRERILRGMGGLGAH